MALKTSIGEYLNVAPGLKDNQVEVNEVGLPHLGHSQKKDGLEICVTIEQRYLHL